MHSNVTQFWFTSSSDLTGIIFQSRSVDLIKIQFLNYEGVMLKYLINLMLNLMLQESICKDILLHTHAVLLFVFLKII